MRHFRVLLFGIIAFIPLTLTAQSPTKGQPSPADLQKEPEKAETGPMMPRRAAPSTARYNRYICLVHMTGSGKADDPRRPEYAPASAGDDRSGIIAWSMQLTDNGQMAIVHYVAVDRKAFEGLRNEKREEVRIFEIGKDKPEAIEKELRKFKKDFILDSLQVVAQ